jgi:dihydrolipoamide dehydrogenase
VAELFDIVIIGGGTGGYVAALRASQLGHSVALIEKNEVGGTCLHKGCIPTKALLRSAEIYREVKKGNEFGIEINGYSLNYGKTVARKNKVVSQLQKGVEFLLKKGKINVIRGSASIGEKIGDKYTVHIASTNEEKHVLCKKIIIATGSVPRSLPGINFDSQNILSSDDMLSLSVLPKSIIIVGGGVIGVEFASLLHDFDVEVAIIEAAERIAPLEDKDISMELQRIFKKKGIKFYTNAKLLVDKVISNDETVSIEFDYNGSLKEITAEKLLMSVGRTPNTSNLGLENTLVEIERGFIKVDNNYQTNNPDIYAIGDVIGGLQLAHVASHEGVVAVEHISGIASHGIKEEHVPKCIYSHPEIASVGLTEQECISKGINYKNSKFSFRAIGKALVHGDVDGFVKVIIDVESGALLGVHMIGPHVTDLISEAALATVLEATAMQIGNTIHPHPSLSEAFMEAGLAVHGRAFHM